MLSEVLDHFGFARDFYGAGYYETPYHRQVLQNLRGAIHAGRLIAFTGLVGSGKTLLLRQLRDILVAEKRVTVSKSLAVDKERTSLTTLITALFLISPRKKSPGSPPRANIANGHYASLSARVRSRSCCLSTKLMIFTSRRCGA